MGALNLPSYENRYVLFQDRRGVRAGLPGSPDPRDVLGNGCADCELVRPGGSIIPCTLQARLLDPLDAKKGGTVVVTDISDKKRMRDALKESEAKSREMMKNAQSIIVRLDMQGTITYVNTYAAAFLNYPRAGLIGKNVVGQCAREKPGQPDLSMMANDLGFNAEGYAINVGENMAGTGISSGSHRSTRRSATSRATSSKCSHSVMTSPTGNRTERCGSAPIPGKTRIIADTDVREEVFDSVFHICTEISIEGREGKAVGTTFLIGDTKNVLAKSRQMILNAFEGHIPEMRMVTNPDLKENIKEFAHSTGHSWFQVTGLSKPRDGTSRWTQAG